LVHSRSLCRPWDAAQEIQAEKLPDLYVEALKMGERESRVSIGRS
jgi:hypothetical protein